MMNRSQKTDRIPEPYTPTPDGFGAACGRGSTSTRTTGPRPSAGTRAPPHPSLALGIRREGLPACGMVSGDAEGKVGRLTQDAARGRGGPSTTVVTKSFGWSLGSGLREGGRNHGTDRRHE